MNQIQELTSRLEQLKDVLEEAKAIFEWHKFKVCEKNFNPSTKVFFQDDTLQQLTDKQAFFQLLWARTNVLLQEKTTNISHNQRGKFQKELNKLSLQFYYIDSDVRIY
jgi:hypothetical protein